MRLFICFVRLSYAQAGTPASFEELESTVLKGQKLQGVLTSNEVQEILRARRWEAQFPLFTTINSIINGNLPPSYVTNYMAGSARALGTLDAGDDDALLDGAMLMGGKGGVSGAGKAKQPRRNPLSSLP